MKLLLLQNWNIFRWLRLLMGILIVVQAAIVSDWMFAAAGAVFTLMALFNTGCCTVNSCPVNSKNKELSAEEVTNEEVK